MMVIPRQAAATVEHSEHRMLEVAFRATGATWDVLREPGCLGVWLVSSADVVGGRVEIVVQEEYGYRRMLAGRLARQPDGFVIDFDRAEREWDGCDGTPVGPAAPASRWDEPQLAGTMLEVTRNRDVPVVRWSGFAADALDATRREGVLLRYAVDRVAERHGPGAGPAHVLEREFDAPASRVWAAVAASGTLRSDPGTCWAGDEGTSGCALLAVAGRRLASSWRAPGDTLPVGMLDLRIGHEPERQTTLQVTLALGRHVEGAQEWLASLVEQLVDAATAVGADA